MGDMGKTQPEHRVWGRPPPSPLPQVPSIKNVLSTQRALKIFSTAWELGRYANLLIYN